MSPSPSAKKPCVRASNQQGKSKCDLQLKHTKQLSQKHLKGSHLEYTNLVKSFLSPVREIGLRQVEAFKVESCFEESLGLISLMARVPDC